MRKILGTILVLYGLLLGFSVTLPYVASIAGPEVTSVTVTDPALCQGAIGSAPLAGFPQRCDVSWMTEEGQATGTLYGKTASGLKAGANTPSDPVHQLGSFAFTAPVGNAELMMAFLALPILLLGFYLLTKRKRRRRRGGGSGSHSDDNDDDSSDGDSDGGGDSGGGDGGGGGD